MRQTLEKRTSRGGQERGKKHEGKKCQKRGDGALGSFGKTRRI